MKDHNKDMLLHSLMHHLDMQTRKKVMAEVPVAYADYCNTFHDYPLGMLADALADAVRDELNKGISETVLASS